MRLLCKCGVLLWLMLFYFVFYDLRLCLAVFLFILVLRSWFFGVFPCASDSALKSDIFLSGVSFRFPPYFFFFFFSCLLSLELHRRLVE